MGGSGVSAGGGGVSANALLIVFHGCVIVKSYGGAAVPRNCELELKRRLGLAVIGLLMGTGGCPH